MKEHDYRESARERGKDRETERGRERENNYSEWVSGALRNISAPEKVNLRFGRTNHAKLQNVFLLYAQPRALQ